MSAREDILKRLEKVLANMTNPGPGKVSRDFFDFEKLAITQFPAILVVPLNESREDISMDERRGVMDVSIRCFVRGEGIDTRRNDIIRNIEESLETERNLSITSVETGTHIVSTQITNVQVIERQPPIGEVTVVATITYHYRKGNA
jgi:hypothetical protein